jgi:glutamine synthetase
MKVTSTIITKVAEATTENGSYNLEYSITDGVLEHIQTTAFKPSTNEHRIAVGSIYYDRGRVTINMPFGKDIAKYVADAVGQIENILSEVATIAAEAE